MAAQPTPAVIDSAVQPASVDLDVYLGHIAKPEYDLNTKLKSLAEIREKVAHLRETDAPRVFGYLVPSLLTAINSGQPAFRKESQEFQYRQLLLDVVNRLPLFESLKNFTPSILDCVRTVLRNDCEDTAAVCCRIIIDQLKSWRNLAPEMVNDILDIYVQSLKATASLIPELFSEGSDVLDPTRALPNSRSFKTINEMSTTITMIIHNMHTATPQIKPVVLAAFEFLDTEAPLQCTTRTQSQEKGITWSGMSPDIKNTGPYNDLVHAQIKVASFILWTVRGHPEHRGPPDPDSEVFGERLSVYIIRLLQDCPGHASTLRKELSTPLRFLVTQSYGRRALVPHVEKLLDEGVLFGTDIGGREMRFSMHSCAVDFVHHSKNDFNAAQLTKVVEVYTRLLLEPTPTFHILFAKGLANLVEVIVTKDNHKHAIQLLHTILHSFLERLDALLLVHEETNVLNRLAQPESPPPLDCAYIEKARPVSLPSFFGVEKPEEAVEARNLFKTLLHGFRTCMNGLKKADAASVDGEFVSRLFVACIRALSLLELDSRGPHDPNDPIEMLSQVLLDVNPHVFQEVWTQRIELFFEAAQKKVILLNICQALFQRDATSPTLLAIVLKFLVDRLPLLGEYDDLRAAATIRLFKMAFGAVASFPPTNEAILATHLAKLLMDCFPLATTATKPTHYFHLLRALFRAIGGGGGRFELLYKEVLPLLPDMLVSLNRQLLASEGATRDLIVELCLTVPLRLTHLLPHLSYLMQPLALALKGTPELVAQGLRTLELCIDNLTPDFLDPTLNIVLRELMEALHAHLKPYPSNHHVAHTTIRILGKLGGRNRRLLSKEPALQYGHHSEHPKLGISFGGPTEHITMGPISGLACRTLVKASPTDSKNAFNYMENCLATMLHDGFSGSNGEELFTKTLEGVFDATFIPDLQENAEQFLHRLAGTIFELEVQKNQLRETTRPVPSSLLIAFLDALPNALSKKNEDDATKSRLLVAALIYKLTTLTDQPNVSQQDILPILHQMTIRFIALCLDDAWCRKAAGCSGIRIMTDAPEFGQVWVTSRDFDLVRSLLHILQDVTPDLPRDSGDIVDLITTILRISSTGPNFRDNPSIHLNKSFGFAGIFFTELHNTNPVVRQTAQTCIQCLVDLTEKPTTELLLPHRDRFVASLYTKPLRALPFLAQIGKIEATRYCISLSPPLIELGDELLRLLHETLAFADAEDNALLGRNNPRQGNIEIIKLRVACIKLLTASMPLTDFFSRQHQTRQRVTGVYFKSLYSPSSEIKDVAHEGLRMVLTHESRLPRELLQTGLRPILMNLADPKRLSVPGLEALARLLELLTNYFKVEIGHKLLDHFRIVADPQMLHASSKLPVADSEGITKLVRLANIFHLLPSTANIFLENLVNAIIQTEAQMHFSGPSPLSDPLAKYLNRYPVEGINFFLQNLSLPRHLRTLRSILQARLAPNVETELAARTPLLVANCLNGTDQLFFHTLHLFSDLAVIIPDWVQDYPYVIDVLVNAWRIQPSLLEPTATRIEITKRYSLLWGIFKVALEQSPRIDLLFEVSSIFALRNGMNVIHTTHFLYRHVALSDDLRFKRNILQRFLTWWVDPSYTWSSKGAFLRYVLTPTLLIHAARSLPPASLVDGDFVDSVHTMIWRKVTEKTAFHSGDDLLTIEILHFTIVMVQYYSQFLDNAKKDIIKAAWHYISINEDAMVKQMAYLLTAKFFATWQSPQKFIARTWNGLLRNQSSEVRSPARQQALLTLLHALPSADSESGTSWALTARRFVVEESLPQAAAIFHLIVKEPDLFYPVRELFVPQMVNTLVKLTSSQSPPDIRILSIDMLQVMVNWEVQARAAQSEKTDGNGGDNVWLTPLSLRESMVGYLVRLLTNALDPSRYAVLQRATNLLKFLSGPNGWGDVAFGLRFFSRALEMTELSAEGVNAGIAFSRVLNIITSEQSDAWYTANAGHLQALIQRGLVAEEYALQDALHPIFDRLIHLFPLPKEDDEQPSEVSELHKELSQFHKFAASAIGDGLRNPSTSRGILLMLKSVVQVTPERIDPFNIALMKVLSRLTKEHIQSAPTAASFEHVVRLMVIILDICQASIAFLGDQRRILLQNMVLLVGGSKSPSLCRYLLDLSRTWAMTKQDPYPSMKEKATLLQKMTIFEVKGDPLFQSYLELIYEIYTDPALRRSELTSRLEHPFLVGCRAKDAALRERFLELLDVSVPRSLFNRLTYICGVQSWEPISDCNWIYLPLYLVLGATELETPMAHDRRVPDQGVLRPRTQAVVRPMQRLACLDPYAAHETWASTFAVAWTCLSRREQTDLTHHMINLLSKDYHIRQAELRPNVIQSLLAGVLACSPPMILPPHLIKYLAKTFGAWHVGLELLSNSLSQVREDDMTIRDYVYDSLADVYAELGEEDLFYGVWRRRCLHLETNIAVSFEQGGMWDLAATAYESAQNKARTGAIPFTESEYCLWEDHWILSAEKLQQWEVLHELGRSEGNAELMLESAWRIKDWTENREPMEEQINLLPETPTPRRLVFEAFIALLKMPAAVDKNVEFTRFLEEAMQLSLRKWVGLPPHLSRAHIPLLQHFQQFVELQEAVQIFGSLSSTNAQNLEKKSSDLKMVLQAWRERLPTIYDDISIWSDLVAWRQNVFHAINKAYIPLIGGPNSSAPTNTNTFGYRGYHETAWIINRFAHVARKHDLLDVCFTSLAKIYTLPNIEISEAFLKLREQARCYYQKPSDLQAGLEVINNTNLVYFSTSQKAEFYTLKGMFHARFGRNDEANNAFGQAVQMDMSQAKAWAEWGRYSDRMHKNNPNDLSHAANAVSCYLQAAAQYKCAKSRPLLSRILWLLSLDDTTFTVSRAFDTFKGDAVFWFWIPLIPQLCASINHREVKQARYILMNLGRHYPQALFFPMRTANEEYTMMKRRAANDASRTSTAGNRPPEPASVDAASSNNEPDKGSQPNGSSQTSEPASRASWDYMEEIVAMVKTTFPLLILSLETMVDQFTSRFKPSPEEDAYRMAGILLQEISQQYIIRSSSSEEPEKITTMSQANFNRMALNLSGSIKMEYEEEFLREAHSIPVLMQRIQRWRDKYEKLLETRPRFQTLDVLSHYLTEFQYSKVDDIEVFGQYTEDKDNNQNFIKIQKFQPKYENCMSHANAWKRITILGSDNSSTAFSVQYPANRQARREERVTQTFRTFNGVLARKKESRKRNLHFHVPAAVSASLNLRFYQTDASYVSFGDIYDLHCRETGIAREDPMLFVGDKLKNVLREYRESGKQGAAFKADYLSLKNNFLQEVATKMVPDDILTRYMVRIMRDPMELWRMRKQFTLQIAATSFMTFVFCLSSRLPSRFLLSRATGLITMSDILPSTSSQQPVLGVTDVVPFRLTPNIQTFIGPIFTEGILAPSIMTIARCLTEPEYELDQHLCLLARDEIHHFVTIHGVQTTAGGLFRASTGYIEGIVKRAEAMACKVEREQALQGHTTVPVLQTVINLISTATNPTQLMKMGEMYYPWF